MTTKSEQRLYYTLFAKKTPGIGNRRGIELLKNENWSFLPLHKKTIQEEVEKEIERIQKAKVSYVIYGDDLYPESLTHIPDPPLMLYYQGSIASHFLNVAVVGTRYPSRYGVEITTKFVSSICEYGARTISGFAIGVDSIVHRKSVEMQVPTIAVLACGLNRDYPKVHHYLRQKIIDTGGAIVSEYDLDVDIQRYHFPVRNRLISGLADFLLVTEASIKSGTMSTVSAALDQGKQVFTIPGNIFDKRVEGNHYLLRNGATPVENFLQMLEDLEGQGITRKPPPAPKSTSKPEPQPKPDESAKRESVPQERVTVLEKQESSTPQGKGAVFLSEDGAKKAKTYAEAQLIQDTSVGGKAQKSRDLRAEIPIQKAKEQEEHLQKLNLTLEEKQLIDIVKSPMSIDEIQQLIQLDTGFLLMTLTKLILLDCIEEKGGFYSPRT